MPGPARVLTNTVSTDMTFLLEECLSSKFGQDMLPRDFTHLSNYSSINHGPVWGTPQGKSRDTSHRTQGGGDAHTLLLSRTLLLVTLYLSSSSVSSCFTRAKGRDIGDWVWTSHTSVSWSSSNSAYLFTSVLRYLWGDSWGCGRGADGGGGSDDISCSDDMRGGGVGGGWHRGSDWGRYRCLSETITVCLSSTAAPQTTTMIIKNLQHAKRSEMSTPLENFPN